MRSARLSALSSPFPFPLMDLELLNLGHLLPFRDQSGDDNKLAILPSGLPRRIERLIGHKRDDLPCSLNLEDRAPVSGDEQAYRLEPYPGRRKPGLGDRPPQLLHLEGSAFPEYDVCLRLLQTDLYFVHAFQAG